MNLHVLIIRIEILKFEARECDETDVSHGPVRLGIGSLWYGIIKPYGVDVEATV